MQKAPRQRGICKILKTKRELINGRAGGKLALLTNGIAGEVSGNDGGKGVRWFS